MFKMIFIVFVYHNVQFIVAISIFYYQYWVFFISVVETQNVIIIQRKQVIFVSNVYPVHLSVNPLRKFNFLGLS